MVMKAFRIGDPIGDYFVYDSKGSVLAPGRWNTPLSPMIYTSGDYATAMLEKLVHGSGEMPPSQHWIEIILSVGLSYEIPDMTRLTAWDNEDGAQTKAYGEAWHRSQRSLLLIVPSVVTRFTNNILINPEHPQFRDIPHGMHHTPVRWDSRLFAAPSSPSQAREEAEAVGHSLGSLADSLGLDEPSREAYRRQMMRPKWRELQARRRRRPDP